MSDGHSIYIVRHAIAAERGEGYPDDSQRPLTPHGIEKFEKAARGLAALDVSVEHILTSPFVRARQTAEILAEILPGRPVIAEVPALAPGGRHHDLAIALESCARYSTIALVGHEPGVGETAARLLGLRVPREFKKGAVCRIDVDTLPPAAPGRLRWFATPKMLVQAGR